MHLKKSKKGIVFLLIAILTLSLLTGCSGSSSNNLSFNDTTVTAQVTAIDGDKVTISIGRGSMPDMSNMGGGQMPGNNSSSSGDMPTPPDQNNADQNSSDKSDNNSNSGQPQMPDGATPGQMGGNQTTATLTITDESVIKTEVSNSNETTEETGSLADVKENTTIEITFDANGNITKVLVKATASSTNGSDNASSVDNGSSANSVSSNTDLNATSYTSSSADENALRVDEGATVAATDLTVTKSSGDSSNTENSDFYGCNAGLLVTEASTATIADSSITTDAKGANAIFAYGTSTKVTVSDTKIRTTKDNSGGVDVTGGATLLANNLDVETDGNSSAAIRSDRGGGTLTVDSGTYKTNGTGSPAVYSTADITVSNAKLTATNSEGIVVEGKNSVTLNNCDLTSKMSGTYANDNNENIHGIMLYQSMSGDADEGTSSFTMKDGSITNKSGDLFYITNTSSTINLENVILKNANDTLLNVAGNNSSRGWGTSGSNGGTVTFTTSNQTLKGNLLCDKISKLTCEFNEKTTFVGAINPDGETGDVNVTLSANSTWKLTSDSYVSSFTGDLSQVDLNGHTLYVDGTAAK